MTQSSAMPVRSARTALLACAVIVVSLAGHSAATGALPDTSALVLAALVGIPATFAFSARRHSAAGIAAYVIAMQVLLHVIASVIGHGHAGSLLPDTAMLSMHVLAALAAAALVTHGNDLIDRWVAYWRQVLAAWQLLVLRVPARITSAHPELSISCEVLAHTIWHRGPPAGAAFAPSR